MNGDGQSVTVVGAGIVGIACAIHLLRDGHDVTVVDRLAPGEACSYGNAGVLASYAVLPVSHPGLLWSVPGMLMNPRGPLAIRMGYLPALFPWLVRFVRAGSMARMQASARAIAYLVEDSLEQHLDLARGAGVDHLLRPVRFIYAYAGEESLARGLAGWDWRKPFGVRFRVARGAELRELEPALSPELSCAVVIDECGQTTDPGALVKGLARHAAASGATLLQRDVLDIRPREGGGVVLDTDDGPIASDRVVVAAGAWSGRLAERCGEPVPLEAERGYHAVLTDPGVMPGAIVGSASGKFIATPMDAGLRLAGTSEFAGLDAPPDFRRADVLRSQVRAMFPGVSTDAYTEWMGQRPTLPDSLPVIGPSGRIPGVYYAFGHQHVGLTTAPRTGRLVADLVAGRRPNVDVAPYRIDRF